MTAYRLMFELRTGNGPTSAYNLREARVEPSGGLVLSGYDSDPELESLIGRSEWEGQRRVEAAMVPRLREALVSELGAAPETDAGLLALIFKGFGGRLQGMTQFGEWLEAHGIPSSYESY